MARRVSAPVWLLLAAGALGLVGACSSGPEKAELTVRGTEMAFAAPDSVAAGDYVLTFANQGSMIHEVAVRDATGRVLRRVGAAPGATASMDLTLVPGTYELGCFEPGHYEQGMKRLMTVTGPSS